MTLCAATLVNACNVDDTGTPCINPNTTFVAQPIAGEDPVVEVINITRDPNCLQFSCLTAQGLPSYCSHTCRYNRPSRHPTACTLDSDCKLPEHCHAGVCNDDNCPPGFFCQIPEPTGSTTNKSFCMRQTGCTTNPD
ncbi:MAG: hypothetical protein EOO40_08380, partial [Deltaproteobacteria bacterium]